MTLREQEERIDDLGGEERLSRLVREARGEEK